MKAIVQGLRRGWQSSERWLAPALLFLLIMLGTLEPGSYFLHFDTPTLSQNAADLVLGPCWGPSGKPGISLLLWLPFLLGGINAFWDIALTTILGMVMLTCFYQLSEYFTGSRRWAVAGTLWFIALPAILYYSRIHLGYPLAFFLLGMLLQLRGRWAWAGLAFGMAPITHLNFLVPVAAWLAWSFLLYNGEKRWRNFIRLGLMMLIPMLGGELIRFLFMGEAFAWAKGVFRAVQRHSESNSGTTWLHLWAFTRYANGWLNTLLLATSVAYPLVRQKKVSPMDALYLAAWSIIGVYTLRTGLTHKEMVPRMLTGVYPMLAIISVYTLRGFTQRVRIRINSQLVTRLVMVVGVLALCTNFLYSILDVQYASQAEYEVADRVIAEAADQGIPVRFYGNPHAAYYFALRHSAEMSINDENLDTISGDTQAILIFDNLPEGDRDILAAVRDDPRIDPADYEINRYGPHLVESRPFNADTRRKSTADFQELNRHLVPLRSEDTLVGSYEIWWPVNPQGKFEAGHDPLIFTYYYEGEGCATPRRFELGTKNYYHVLGDKLMVIWSAVSEGNLGEARELIWQWIEE